MDRKAEDRKAEDSIFKKSNKTMRSPKESEGVNTDAKGELREMREMIVNLKGEMEELNKELEKWRRNEEG